MTDTWRDKPSTDAQKAAIFNMRFALGMKGEALHSKPATRGQASDEIQNMRQTIHNNLSIGGSINPCKSVWAGERDWGVGTDD